ncbi:MAG: hypothetical protein QM811_16900 [Pirellulales bacterium]
MASSSAIRAGQAYVEMGVDNAKLNAGLRSGGDSLKAYGASAAILGAKIAAVGGIATGLFKVASNDAAKMGREFVGLSDRTGLSVETLSELSYASKEVGTDMSALEGAMAGLGKTMLNAFQGNQGARQAFANLGLSAQQLHGMAPEQQLTLIADRLAGIRDPGLRAAAAVELLGTRGEDLLPLLNKGAAGIDALRKKAHDLGYTMSTEDAQAAKEYGDAMNALSLVVSMSWIKLGRAAIPIAKTVVPMFVDLTAVLTDAAKAAGDWFASNKQLVLWALQNRHRRRRRRDGAR